MNSTRYPLALALLGIALPCAAAPWSREAIDGVVFFAILFALLIYALVARIRDARSGLPAETLKARQKKRLGIVMGGLFGACAYAAFTSM